MVKLMFPETLAVKNAFGMRLCCQILGFDVLLMKNLKPVLLEVNANPSMRIEHEQEVWKAQLTFPPRALPDNPALVSQVAPGVFECVPSPVDEEVKVGVIRDTLRLVDPAGLKRAASYVPVIDFPSLL